MPANGYVSPRTYDELTAAATEWTRKKMEHLVTRALPAGVNGEHRHEVRAQICADMNLGGASDGALP